MKINPFDYLILLFDIKIISVEVNSSSTQEKERYYLFFSSLFN